MQNLDIFGGASTPHDGKAHEGYNTVQLKAIEWYCDNNDCRLELSLHPIITFVQRHNSERIQENIHDLVSQYKSWKAEDNKERARARRIAKAEALRDERGY